MPLGGRISGWDIFVASFERYDRNLSCTKSSAVNALIASVFAAGVGFAVTYDRRIVYGSGLTTLLSVFVLSNLYCINNQITKELAQAERSQG